MNAHPGFTDFFMSPVTGRIILPMFPDLTKNYVWIGDRNDRPIASPILIDLRLEIIDLRNRLSRTRFILQAPSENFDSSQALNQLVPGILRHDNGIVSIETLPYHNIWIGDINNNPVPQPRIWDDGVGNGNLPAYTSEQYKMIWRMDASGIPILSTDVTTIEINIESILDHLVDIDIHLGDIDIEIGDINIEIGDINTRIDSIEGELVLPHNNIWIGDSSNVPQPNPRILLQNLPSMLSADPTLLLGAYNLYQGDPDPLNLGNPKIVKTLNLTNMADLPAGYLWLGTNSTDPLNFGLNRPVPIIVLPLDNMADLPYKKIWRGDITNRPYPVDDLTNLEDRVTTTEENITEINDEITTINETLTTISDQISTINSQISSILDSIATINTQITSILDAITTINAQITSILDSITTINTRLDGIDVTLGDLQAQIDSNVASGLSHLADLQLQIDNAIASGNDHLATINTTLDYLQSEIDTVNSSITTINTTLTSLQTQIDTINTTLTTIEGDITNITDVLIPAVYTYIDSAISNVTNNFVAGGVINMNNNRITNLPCDPVEDNDALSFCFFWHFAHDEVTVSWS